MSENIRVVVTGVSGRMGQMIVSGVLSSTKTRLVGALEREGHDWIGQDLGLVSGLNTLGVEVSDDPASVFKDADAIVDFSAPKASVEFSKLAAERGIVHVIGTTGFNDQELALIENSGKKAKIIRAIPLPPISLKKGPIPIFPPNKKVKFFFNNLGTTIELRNE